MQKSYFPLFLFSIVAHTQKPTSTQPKTKKKKALWAARFFVLQWVKSNNVRSVCCGSDRLAPQRVDGVLLYEMLLFCPFAQRRDYNCGGKFRVSNRVWRMLAVSLIFVSVSKRFLFQIYSVFCRYPYYTVVIHASEEKQESIGNQFQCHYMIRAIRVWRMTTVDDVKLLTM